MGFLLGFVIIMLLIAVVAYRLLVKRESGSHLGTASFGSSHLQLEVDHLRILFPELIRQQKWAFALLWWTTAIG